MDQLIESIIFFVVLIIMLLSGAWIFVAILITSIFAFYFFLDFSWFRIGSTFRPVIMKSLLSPELAAIPLFVFMGEIISRTQLATRLFQGLAPWVSRLPGGLLHVNVAGSVLFAAFSGSSAATTATVGRVTLRELTAHKYDQNLALGSICVAGTIGIMIPPSITLIIYGVLAEVSVAKLFAAGVVPGLILGLLYSGYIAVRCAISPQLSPSRAEKTGWGERIAALSYLTPVFILIVAIIGSIYTGFATPSEAAAVGVVASIAIAAAFGGISVRMIGQAALSSVLITAMIGTIIAASAPLASAVGYMHLTHTVAEAINALHLNPFMLIVILTVFYIALGAALDGISMILMTVPFTLPLIQAQGFDPIWFGVYVVLVVEMSLVSPPVGLNLYVTQAVTGVPQGKVAWASLPFFLMMLIAAALFTVFPQIALWLPGMMR